MDKIWDRKTFEVGGHWPLTEWPGRSDKSRTLKKKKDKQQKYIKFICRLKNIFSIGFTVEIKMIVKAVNVFHSLGLKRNKVGLSRVI